MTVAGDAREKLAALARATVTDLHVDGWSPRDALVMGAMHAADALVLSHGDALLDAIHEVCDHEDESATVMMCRKCGLVI